MKRKFNLISDDRNSSAPFSPSVARVEIENECIALREVLSRQQEAIQDLYTELEEERNASSSAASEAMSMILRLQREKAEVQMEARQYKRFTEEKMAHDQQELFSFEDLLYRKDQIIQSLTCEIQAYKHRLMSCGLSESEAEGAGTEADVGVSTSGNVFSPCAAENVETQFEVPASVDYPPLKCNTNETPVSLDVGNGSPFHIDKYAFGETPRAREQLQDLEHRINQLERTPRHGQMDRDYPSTRHFLEKAVAGQSPRRHRHSKRFSTDSFGSFSALGKEKNQDYNTWASPKTFQLSSFKKMEEFSNMDEYNSSRKMDNASDLGDDMTDRIYTIDSIQGVPYNGLNERNASFRTYDDYITTPRESLTRVDTGEMEIKKLYMRLHALEAERESMRQDLICMRTDQAQMIFMKAVAQHLCQEMTQEKNECAKKPSPVGSFPITSVLKWVVSFVSWRKKAKRCKHTLGLSDNNAGLLLLLDRNPPLKQWRSLKRAAAA